MTKFSKTNTRFFPKGLTILYEDGDILVVDKPAGLLTMATDSEKTKTAYAALTDYVKKGSIQSKKRIFIVHRLDRDTSGILIFAKTEDAKLKLQSDWDRTKKKYIAVTHGNWDKSSGTITSYLTENKAQVVYSTKEPSLGKLSHTLYKVLKETKNYSLVEVDLLTGRKNQIRVHFADEKHPIIGDKKYGDDEKSYSRMALHSWSISFLHPFNGKEMFLRTEVPAFLTGLVGGFEFDSGDGGDSDLNKSLSEPFESGESKNDKRQSDPLERGGQKERSETKKGKVEAKKEKKKFENKKSIPSQANVHKRKDRRF
ncbi:RluA family pseudouridine synthase [Leptospira ilyithenensis]|uniref:RNA pseudouridine synthase n=1 Tax=Leptospira ilyithenensis TaxID=2484901 RepID=A0A4R9LMP6_9LEPT|nr:RNA pseudouridine synthase [Leptospira ilyithenensis]TGN09842.1 RNA pseudouridine synthase [Leptospira ilyithenensis]